MNFSLLNICIPYFNIHVCVHITLALLNDLFCYSILGPPRFVTVPTNTSASAGHNVTFTCTAFAVPQPMITWSHTSLGGIMRNLTARTNVLINGNTIQIFDVEYFQDGGEYTCTANNSHGVTETSAFLNLDCKYMYYSIRLILKYKNMYVHACVFIASLFLIKQKLSHGKRIHLHT